MKDVDDVSTREVVVEAARGVVLDVEVTVVAHAPPVDSRVAMVPPITSAIRRFIRTLLGNLPRCHSEPHVIARRQCVCLLCALRMKRRARLDGSGPNGPGGMSQSFGQDVKLKLANPHEFNPGDACGPGTNPDRRR
jgi:hypothetical protein